MYSIIEVIEESELQLEEMSGKQSASSIAAKAGAGNALEEGVRHCITGGIVTREILLREYCVIPTKRRIIGDVIL